MLNTHSPSVRYGLVVRISGSHPGGPGSIPGNGNLFPPLKKKRSTYRYSNKKYIPTPGVEPGPPG